MQEIRMVGSLPNIQSAISLSGEGSARVKLDFAESELAEVIKLMLLKGQSFEVIFKALQ